MIAISKRQTSTLGGRLYSVMDTGTAFLRNETCGIRRPFPLQNRTGPMDIGGGAEMNLGESLGAVSGSYVEVECRYATQEQFKVSYVAEEPNGNIEIRQAAGTLTLDPEHVFLKYDIDSPNGIPIGWRHDLEYNNPVGRCLSMRAVNGELVGRSCLSLAEVNSKMPGGLADLQKGMNVGLSISFEYLDPLDIVEQGAGTHAEPDMFHIGRISIFECSLTPLPRLPSSGILGIGAKEDSGMLAADSEEYGMPKEEYHE